MSKIETLRHKVREIYEAKHPARAEWADWLYENHVFIVADNARVLSERFGGQSDLAEAASLLHDIADALMSRFGEGHKEKSLEVARILLVESGFSEAEIKIVVDDAIANHSCYPGHLPETLEGKIMATADAKAHLDTDYYYYCFEQWSKSDEPSKIQKKLPEKIDRDFNVKIFFGEVRDELEVEYKKRKQDFGLE